MLPEQWRRKLVESGAPKRKYSAVVRVTLDDGRVIEDLIIEEGWIIALDRAGLAGTFEQRIDFNPRQIVAMDIKHVI